MKVLAIETTDISGSLAAAELSEANSGESDNKDFQLTSSSIKVYNLTSGQRSAQSLAPSIDRFLKELGWNIRDLGCIAVGVGPGSFTGLRVGVTTAKILAWALGAKIIGVNTLESMSWNVPRDSEDRILSCAVDAQRGEAAIQRFFIPADLTMPPIPIDDKYKIMSIKKWLGIEKDDRDSKTKSSENNTEKANYISSKLVYQKVNEAQERGLMFCSSLLIKWQEKADEAIRTRFVPPEFWRPDAVGILKAACLRIQRKTFDDVWAVLPEYSRLSAAQERLLARNKEIEKSKNPL